MAWALPLEPSPASPTGKRLLRPSLPLQADSDPAILSAAWAHILTQGSPLQAKRVTEVYLLALTSESDRPRATPRLRLVEGRCPPLAVAIVRLSSLRAMQPAQIVAPAPRLTSISTRIRATVLGENRVAVGGRLSEGVLMSERGLRQAPLCQVTSARNMTAKDQAEPPPSTTSQPSGLGRSCVALLRRNRCQPARHCVQTRRLSSQ